MRFAILAASLFVTSVNAEWALRSIGTPVIGSAEQSNVGLNIGAHQPGDLKIAFCFMTQSADPPRVWAEDSLEGYTIMPELSANPVLSNGRGTHIQIGMARAQSSDDGAPACRTTPGGSYEDGAAVGGNVLVFSSSIGFDVATIIHNAAVSETNNPGNIVTPPLPIGRNNTLVIAAAAIMADWTTVYECCGFTKAYESSSLAGGDLGHTVAYEIQTTATDIPASQFTVVDENRLFSPEGSSIFALQEATRVLRSRRTSARFIPDGVGGMLALSAPRRPLREEETPPDPDPPDPDPPSGLKWNPGHGVKTQGNHSQSNQQSYLDAISNQLTATLAGDELEYAFVAYAWGAVNPTDGVYNWAPIYQHLNWLEARDKSLLIGIETKCFSSNCGVLAPSDLTGDIVVGQYPMLATYRESVMDRFIEFMEALAEEFDDHPSVTAIELGTELCPSWGGNPASDYTHNKLLTQWARKQDAAALLFEKTVIYNNINCDVGNNAQMLIENAYQETCHNANVVTKLGRSSPDVHDDHGRNLFQGLGNAQRDYRGLIPHKGRVSAPNLGGKDNMLPLSNIIDAIITHGFTHVSWVVSDPDAPLATIVDIIRDMDPDIQETVECD